MEQRKGPPIGIDLGTAYTRAAVSNGDYCRIIPDDNGNLAMPSYVAFTDSGVLVGEAARKQALQNPTNTIFDVIRLVRRRYSDPSIQNDMRRWPFKVMAGPDDRLQVEVSWKGRLWQFTPVEICSMILMQIKENAETSLGETIADAVITVPVHFNYEQRLAIRQAGMIAGLNFMQILCAPAASAFFYGLERQSKLHNMIDLAHLLTIRPEEHNILIFDLGAGTLDVAVVAIKEDLCKLRAAAGDIHLGGSDFDNNLVDYFVNFLKKIGREDISVIPMAISNLRTSCEKAKMSLSSGNSIVPMKITPLYNDVNFDSSITEAKFIELNNDLFLKCIHIIEMCLRDAKINIDGVHEVVLAGSAARIPMLQHYIQSHFGCKVLNISHHLETATAFGAAFQAFFFSRRENKKVHRLSLVDVAPFTLGLRLVEVMLACVPKNMNIPIKIEKTFRSNRRPFLVEVYEGEGTLICENNFLGKFELSGIQTSPHWRDIIVCFEIHENGILTVMAEEIPSGKRNSITLTNDNIEESQKRVCEALLYKGSAKGVSKASTSKKLTTSRTSREWDKAMDSKILDSLLSFEKECSEKNMGQSTTKSLATNGSSHMGDQVRDSKILDGLLSMEKERSEKIMRQSSRQNVEPEEYVLGIDFGTTYSCVAVWQQNGVKIIQNEYGSHLTCSSVAFTDTGRLIGDTVHKEHIMNTIPNIKRLIGRCFSEQSVQNDDKFLPFRVLCGTKNRSLVSVQYNDEEKLFAPEEIAAMILSKLKEIAEEHLNSKVTNAVISVPACFRDSQRKAIKDAGAIAGFNVLQLLNEPTAAAIAYFLQELSCQSSGAKTLLIFDLGGGNLDVSIVTINEGTIKVQSVAGDSNLGGEDFDNNMVSHFVKIFMKEKKKDIWNKPRSLGRLRIACEKAKRTLSTNAQTVVEIDALDEGIDFHSTITRKVFEELNEDLFKRSIGCVERCLEDAKMDRNCIDEVVLVGGSTRIPKIRQLLQEFFNRKDLCKSMDAEEAVAYGAAVQAAILSSNGSREKFNMLELQDVSSLSFGIGYEDGATMNLLIPKHTPIPAKKELLITTRSDYLSSLSLDVEECELASTTVFSIYDIAPKPRGSSKIIVSFEVDNSGILNVTAKDMNAREKNQIVISKENGSLTTEEVQKMLEAAVRNKAEDKEHKARLAALNSLENFAYKMKAIVRDPGISTAMKKSVEEAADNAIAWLDANHCAAIDEISGWKKQLETIKSHTVYLGKEASL